MIVLFNNVHEIKIMSTPRVSVCVMTYNQEKYIAECLQSIVEQDVDFAFEVIVADDCSSDETINIILGFAARYPDIVKPVLHEKNVGVGANYRAAHDRAIGEFVAHCDGDDMWLPGKLKYQVELLDRNPDASQCWGCAHLIDDDGVKIGVFPSKLARWLNPNIITAKHIALSYALVGQHSTQMYRRKFKFDFDSSRPVLDFWIAFNMALSGPAIYSKKFLSCYRVTKTPSMTRTKANKKATVDFLAMHLGEIISKTPIFSIEAKSQLVARYIFSKFMQHNLDVIKYELNSSKKVILNPWMIFKSCLFFLIQKIR